MTIDSVPWAGWSVVSHIGSGGFGSVYEIRRDRFGYTERSAVKVIEIPTYAGDIEAMRSDGFEEESIAQHFKEVLEDIVREYSLMAEMKGHSNIVDCDDPECVPHGDGIGCPINVP